MGSRLSVAEVYNLDVVVQAAVVNRHDMSAAQRIDCIDTLRRQCPRNQFTT
jgi:hypothetical protein